MNLLLPKRTLTWGISQIYNCRKNKQKITSELNFNLPYLQLGPLGHSVQFSSFAKSSKDEWKKLKLISCKSQKYFYNFWSRAKFASEIYFCAMRQLKRWVWDHITYCQTKIGEVRTIASNWHSLCYIFDWFIRICFIRMSIIAHS